MERKEGDTSKGNVGSHNDCPLAEVLSSAFFLKIAITCRTEFLGFSLKKKISM